MNKAIFVQEIMNDISLFDIKKLKEINKFIKYLKYQDLIDPTLEILSNEDWTNITLAGIKEKESGEIISWDSLK
jgi:hypothetical protein